MRPLLVQPIRSELLVGNCLRLIVSIATGFLVFFGYWLTLPYVYSLGLSIEMIRAGEFYVASMVGLQVLRGFLDLRDINRFDPADSTPDYLPEFELPAPRQMTGPSSSNQPGATPVLDYRGPPRLRVVDEAASRPLPSATKWMYVGTLFVQLSMCVALRGNLHEEPLRFWIASSIAYWVVVPIATEPIIREQIAPYTWSIFIVLALILLVLAILLPGLSN